LDEGGTRKVYVKGKRRARSKGKEGKKGILLVTFSLVFSIHFY
jgi:hypothetical protein